jgi:hypothetical protein
MGMVAMVMAVMVMAVPLVNCMSVTVMPDTVEATGMAAQSIGTGTPIGMVAIGVGTAIGIGGTVDGGPMALVLVGESSLAAGFGSVTDSARSQYTICQTNRRACGKHLHPRQEAITNDLVDMRAGE